MDEEDGVTNRRDKDTNKRKNGLRYDEYGCIISVNCVLEQCAT